MVCHTRRKNLAHTNMTHRTQYVRCSKALACTNDIMPRLVGSHAPTHQHATPHTAAHGWNEARRASHFFPTCFLHAFLMDHAAPDTAQRVWREVLGPEAGSREQYETRIHGKKLPLANIDRPAPPPSTPMLQHQYNKAMRRATRTPAKAKRTPRRPIPSPSLPHVEPLVTLWTSYIRDALGLHGLTRTSANQRLQSNSWVTSLQTSLLKMDWTGARVTGTFRCTHSQSYARHNRPTCTPKASSSRKHTKPCVS